VMDIIEIESPFAIASASMDSTIKLYSLVDKSEISVLNDHCKGVRSLTYNPNFGGFIVSAGFERNIYIWSPEVTYRKSLIGKLEGHTEIVSAVQFLNLKPYCVSVDEKFNVRFWDVRTQVCVQVLANETNAQVPCFGLFVFPQNPDIFVIKSKRMLFYETVKFEGPKNVKGGDKNEGEDITPIKCELNSYYLSFTIVTHLDIRIYNAKDGKLQKII